MEGMESGKRENEKESAEERQLVSPAAFVDGGIQDPCDDACSICLEDFSDDPSSVTVCKHEFHLQCILEWCQRSSQCPMCWRPISLKDPASQELLEAVETERNFRVAPPRNTTIFHHPTLGDFELQHLPSGVNEAELEERIIQHLAAAAAMGRTHHVRVRESHRGRSSGHGHGRPHYVLFSAQPGSGDHPVSAPEPSEPAPQQISRSPFVQMAQNPSSSASGSSAVGTSFINRNSVSQSSPDGAGPSDLQSFSDALKSKFNAVSTRYKESLSKSTRGWKERLFSRNSPAPDSGSEVRREVNQGIASVSRLVERLDMGDDNNNNNNNDTAVTRESISDILANDSGGENSARDSESRGAATTTSC